MILRQIIEPTIALIREVGKFIQQESLVFETSSIEKKGFNDLVSYVDKQAEKQLVDGLGIILPEAGFIAEEGGIGDTHRQGA